jgi:MraZ protein
MFRGINLVNVDGKGRMPLPARFRETLMHQADGQLIVTIDTEQKCLLLYQLKVWEEIEKKIAALPSFQVTTRRIQRLLIGHATEVKLDTHGRILLPALLRNYAVIDKEVIVLGQGNKFELWSKANWETSRDEWLSADSVGNELLPEELKGISL